MMSTLASLSVARASVHEVKSLSERSRRARALGASASYVRDLVPRAKRVER